MSVATENLQPQMSDYWRSMGLFNIYRVIIALVLTSSYYFTPTNQWLDNYDKTLYLQCAYGYVAMSFIAIIFTWIKWPKFNLLLSLQVMTDIGFIVALMFASGGIKSGSSLLLVVAIAAASLISRGRLAMFYAAIATIAVLLEQSYQMIYWRESYDDYSHAVMLSLSFFATALLAHSLAKRAHQSEALASQRGIDLENLAQINTLITQEIQDGVLVVDQHFKLRHRNMYAKTLLDVDDEAWQSELLDSCSPKVANLMRDWIAKQPGMELSTLRISTSGKELKLRFMPIAAERAQGAVIFIEDWSQAQAQAQRVKLAALGRLTANIAHEIRNPLSAISHANQLLQEELSDASSQRLLQITADNVKRLDQIISDVLELNRRDRTNQEEIQLDTFLRDFHDQFCQIEKIPENGFQLNVPSNQYSVLFDHRHLHQILWNTCRNGWRHSKQGTKSLSLTVTKASPENNTLITIQDDGDGITADARSHLFEPFFTTAATGTGLGLYIARELCEANGASIQHIPSETETLFTISLKNVH